MVIIPRKSAAESVTNITCSRLSKPGFEKISVIFLHLYKINLIHQNFIAYRQNAQIIKSWFKHHFKKSNIHLQSVLTVDSHQAIISAIQHHVGMGIIASHIVNKEIQQGKIIGIKTSKAEIRNQISLTQLRDKILTLTEKVFINFLLKEIELVGLKIEG